MKKTFSFLIALIMLAQFLCITSYAQSNVKTLSKPQPSILTNKKDALKLSWAPVKGAEYYVIYRTDGDPKGKYKLTSKVEKCSYIDKVPELNKTYYYFIRAKGSNNIQSNSKVVYSAVVPLKTSKPAVSEHNEVSIKLQWNFDKNASYYKIYRKASEGNYSYIGTSTGGVYYDENILKLNALYYYKIIAIKKLADKEYTGSYSNEVYIRTSKNYQKSNLPEIDNEWAYFLINKNNYLPDNYSIELTYINENRLIDKRCAKYAEEMLTAAENDGIYLDVISGYRTYERQIFNLEYLVQSFEASGYTRDNAYIAATMEIAPPGASEHNAGLALDILSPSFPNLSKDFDKTKEFEWLKNNSWKYGFILRYLKNKEDITGYIYEPWHYRFIGLYHAEQIYNSGLCLEEYMELSN